MKTEHRVFPAVPQTVEEALRNLTALAGELPEHRPYYTVDLIWVACFGPMHRWDRYHERYQFLGPVGSGLRETFRAAYREARAMSARVTDLLGTEKPTTVQVRAALARVTAGED